MGGRKTSIREKVTTALTRRSTVVWTSASQTREWQSAFQTMGTITQKLHAVSAPREDIQDSDATMVLVSTDANTVTDGSNVLMLAMRWTASGVSALEFLCLGMPGRPRTVVPVTTTPLGMDSGATWGSASWDLGLATAPPSARTAPTRARLVSLQRRETRLQHSSWRSLKRLQRRL